MVSKKQTNQLNLCELIKRASARTGHRRCASETSKRASELAITIVASFCICR